MRLSLSIIIVFFYGFFLLSLHAAPEDDDLAAVNPDIDFSNLLIDNVYELTAPDPLSPAEPAPNDCVCDWTISHERAGAFNPYDGCNTSLVIFSGGTGTITLDVDCGDEDTYTLIQGFTSHGASPSPDVSISGSGCALLTPFSQFPLAL